MTTSTFNIDRAQNVYFTQSNQGDTVRLLLVGRTGSGKSSSGNTILGAKKFKVGFSGKSVTKSPCLEEGGEFPGGSVLKVMDTPGLFDTDTTHEDTAKQLQEALVNMHPGPHAILYVVSLSQPYSEEDFKTFKRLKTYFDPRFLQYTIVVFTHGDRLKKKKKSLDCFLKTSTAHQKTVLQECGMRYVAFNNENPSDRNQVQALFDKVQEFKKLFYRRPFLSTEEFDQTLQAADQSEIMGSPLHRLAIDDLESAKEVINKLQAENRELKEAKEVERNDIKHMMESMRSIKNLLIIGFGLTCIVVIFWREFRMLAEHCILH
ncbi:uncharacterized protein [Littorina saxatilis]|uniref:AIG1-type G domain-containing protein n=1 Tax=Littorina saxatilis TaxID=31220 RepID=A0AAN9BHP4_9CAEN